MKIGVDFDSVLSDTMVSWVAKYNEKYNKSITKHTHITRWEFWHDLGISKDEALSIFHNVWTNWKELPPTEANLNDKLKKLSSYGQLDVITEIHEDHLIHVKMWLKENDIDYNELVLAQGKKADFNYDYFIDDNPNFASEVSLRNKNCLLYDQPWNKDVFGKNITRIKDLTEAFSEISKKI